MSGIYPPAASVPGKTEDRAFSTREKEALELWTGLLRDGGATVKTTDYVEAVRFSKVSQVLQSFDWRGADLAERVELRMVVDTRVDAHPPCFIRQLATGGHSAIARLYAGDCRCRVR